MKFLDGAVLTVDRPEYEKQGLKKGMKGTILIAEIRQETFEVEFMQNMKTIAIAVVYVGDLEVYYTSNISDAQLLDNLPTPNPLWWCKVEDGYILNLNGDRKNKIAYDYRS